MGACTNNELLFSATKWYTFELHLITLYTSKSVLLLNTLREKRLWFYGFASFSISIPDNLCFLKWCTVDTIVFISKKRSTYSTANATHLHNCVISPASGMITMKNLKTFSPVHASTLLNRKEANMNLLHYMLPFFFLLFKKIRAIWTLSNTFIFKVF